jgi:lipopolysaccharide/colanic/teichoic acid biosynthesis glycosyltransferase
MSLGAGLTTTEPLAPEVCALDRCDWLSRFPVRASVGRSYLIAKRLGDIVIATALLIMTFPVLVAAAIAIKLESPRGRVVFVQTRAGQCGRSFRLYKLRTMVPDATQRKAELLHLNTRQWPDFKIEHDPRVLRVGRILRAASIDELPQLFNVLKGNMTLVGPRPTSLVAEGFQHWQRERFCVKPGLTGLWQVSGREEPSLEFRSRLDIAYATRRSIALDAFILAKTVPAVVNARGAY